MRVPQYQEPKREGSSLTSMPPGDSCLPLPDRTEIDLAQEARRNAALSGRCILKVPPILTQSGKVVARRWSRGPQPCKPVASATNWLRKHIDAFRIMRLLHSYATWPPSASVPHLGGVTTILVKPEPTTILQYSPYVSRAYRTNNSQPSGAG